MFEGFTNIASMMQAAQQIPAKMEQLNDELKAQSVTGTAGGGMVHVEMNGIGEVTSIRIEQDLIDQGDRELIEDLLPAAINDATAKTKGLHAEAMQRMAGNMNLPGIGEMLAKFSGNGPSPS